MERRMYKGAIGGAALVECAGWASCLAKVKVIKYAHKYATQKCSKKIKPERESERGGEE